MTCRNGFNTDAGVPDAHERRLAKDRIAEAYLVLLCTKQPDEISVCELTRRAHVSRMAYYRNFGSKQNIVTYYLDVMLWGEIGREVDAGLPFWSAEYGRVFFTAMKSHRLSIITLAERGYSDEILESFNRRVEMLAGDMPARSADRYELYFAAGAAYNGMMKWLRGGCKESVKQIVVTFSQFSSRVRGA